MLFSSQRYFLLAILAAMVLIVAFLQRNSLAIESSRKSQGVTAYLAVNSSSQKKSAQDEQRRLREGTHLDNQSGYFRLDGEGARFVSNSGFEFGGLPNLNLERVVRVLKNAEDSESIRWIVSGVVTEFSDQNFLLIGRAVYKSAAQPPVPEQLH